MCKLHKFRICIFVCLLLSLGAVRAEELHTRADIRARYAECVTFLEDSPYENAPVVSGEYAPGALTVEAQSGALAYLNFLRYLAYLDGEVAADALYTLRAQHGAVLLAANDALAHDSPCPEDMPGDFYLTAHTGTMSSNIACINWMEDNILITAVEFFARDDGEANLETLGHRRWLLDPRMQSTGFGLANSETGLTYAVMYAHDASRDVSGWDSVRWPSQGAFPADLMTDGLAWSVILDPSVYDVASSMIDVRMSERESGEVSVKYLRVDSSGYGAGPCVIFMPDLDGAGVGEYMQNQIWDIEIDGLVDVNGNDTQIAYTVEMMSLYPIDPANVEISSEYLEMSPGDEFVLSADVIPRWADDISVEWSCDNAAVASVENGTVTALSAGQCTVIARSINGRCAECIVTVR